MNCPSNLISVCRVCHDRIHDNPAWALQLGYRVRRGVDPAQVPVLMAGRMSDDQQTAALLVLLTVDGGVAAVADVEFDGVSGEVAGVAW